MRKGRPRKEHEQAPLSCDADDTIEVGKAAGQLERPRNKTPRRRSMGPAKTDPRAPFDDIDGLAGQNRATTTAST